LEYGRLDAGPRRYGALEAGPEVQRRGGLPAGEGHSFFFQDNFMPQCHRQPSAPRTFPRKEPGSPEQAADRDLLTKLSATKYRDRR